MILDCKACGAQLDQEMELCPKCGMKIEKEEQDLQEDVVQEEQDMLLSEEELEEDFEEENEEQASTKKGIKVVKIAMAFIAVAALLCMLVAVIFYDVLIPGHWFSTLPGTIPQDGNKDNVTCQGTYTDSVVSLKWKKDTVVAKIGDMTLTNGQLQIFYDMVKSSFVQNNTNLSSMNLNLSQPLDRQTCGLDGSLTWQQYFLRKALDEWTLYAVLGQLATEEGYELTAEDQETLNELYNQFYKSYVTTGKYPSVDAVIQERAGLGCDFSDYLAFNRCQMLASLYYNKLIGEYVVTEEQIDAYFQEYQELLEQNNIKKDDGNYLVDVRHILITVQQATSKEEHIEEHDWERTREMAQGILDEWLAGEATEESFAKLVQKYSSDPGSYNNGGLYAGVQKGEMVDAFDDWCFDENRKIGDYGLVRTDYGYHIMYFSGTEEYWHTVCREDVPYWQTDLMLNAKMEDFTVELYFQKMSLWESAYSK